MKILEFRAENVQKLSIVHFKPDPKKGTVIVAGLNEQGKSTVLDSIQMAIVADNIPAQPIRKGQTKGEVEIDLGEFRLRRTFTPSGGSLTVWDKSGIKQPSPQALLDRIYNKVAFDPLAFARSKPAEQTSTLTKLLGLDFTAFDRQKDEAFEERTIVNRDVKNKEAILRSSPVQEGIPEAEESTAAVLEEQRLAGEVNAGNARIRAEYDQLRDKTEVASKENAAAHKAIEEVQEEIQRLQKKLTGAVSYHSETELKLNIYRRQLASDAEAIKALHDVPTAPFAEKLKSLEATNAKVRRNNEAKKNVEQLHEFRRKSEKLTEKLEAIDRAKKDAMAKAPFPIPGLGFNDANEVTLDDLPFSQASTAGKIRASVAIGLALNPKLRVLCIRQGNDLDDNNLKLIGQMAEAADAQVWIERVSTQGDVSIILEDGHIQGVIPMEETVKAEAAATPLPKPQEEKTLL